MSEANQRPLRAVAAAYAAARADYKAAKADSEAAYNRLEASPETLEYQIDWNVARRAEAAAALRFSRAMEAYRDAGGYVGGPGPDE